MTWKFRALVFPLGGSKPRNIIPMSAEDRRTNEELHRRRDERRRAAEASQLEPHR